MDDEVSKAFHTLRRAGQDHVPLSQYQLQIAQLAVQLASQDKSLNYDSCLHLAYDLIRNSSDVTKVRDSDHDIKFHKIDFYILMAKLIVESTKKLTP